MINDFCDWLSKSLQYVVYFYTFVYDFFPIFYLYLL